MLDIQNLQELDSGIRNTVRKITTTSNHYTNNDIYCLPNVVLDSRRKSHCSSKDIALPFQSIDSITSASLPRVSFLSNLKSTTMPLDFSDTE